MSDSKDFWVGDRFVRPNLGQIQLGPERVHLEPRSMEVLLALASSPSEVIPKQELIETVWGEDAFVSDEVLTHAIWDLRRAFGDNASDPEFIQTIPKKGYRLIAPVKPLERPRRRATDRQPGSGEETPRSRSRWRTVAWGLALLAVLVIAGLWLRQRPPTVAQPATAAGSVALSLLSTLPADDQPEWAQRTDIRLRSELAGVEGVDVRRAPGCEAARGAEQSFCLEPSLYSITDGQQLSLSLTEAGSGHEVFATPMTTVTTGDELDAAVTEHAERVTAFFEIQRDKYAANRDIVPWISTRRYDPRAVRDFLLAMKYVFRHETGGREAMAAAIERDTDFIAPRVWRTPTIVAEGDPAAVAAHRSELERLWYDATAFEKAMIQWAIATIDRDLAVAIRQLRIAFEEQPGNRPVLHVLAASLMDQGDMERAWDAFEQLLAERWDFPGLYPLAAYCAVLRDQMADVRRVVEQGLEVEPVDPETLAQSLLLAIYDGDAEREAALRARLDSRSEEMLPEVVVLAYREPTARYLAERAEARGRYQIAASLRESAN